MSQERGAGRIAATVLGAAALISGLVVSVSHSTGRSARETALAERTEKLCRQHFADGRHMGLLIAPDSPPTQDSIAMLERHKAGDESMNFKFQDTVQSLGKITYDEFAFCSANTEKVLQWGETWQKEPWPLPASRISEPKDETPQQKAWKFLASNFEVVARLSIASAGRAIAANTGIHDPSCPPDKQLADPDFGQADASTVEWNDRLYGPGHLMWVGERARACVHKAAQLDNNWRSAEATAIANLSQFGMWPDIYARFDAVMEKPEHVKKAVVSPDVV
jgi:hypothetical protein